MSHALLPHPPLRFPVNEGEDWGDVLGRSVLGAQLRGLDSRRERQRRH
jgi:hypothetical protein